MRRGSDRSWTQPMAFYAWVTDPSHSGVYFRALCRRGVSTATACFSDADAGSSLLAASATSAASAGALASQVALRMPPVISMSTPSSGAPAVEADHNPSIGRSAQSFNAKRVMTRLRSWPTLWKVTMMPSLPSDGARPRSRVERILGSAGQPLSFSRLPVRTRKASRRVQSRFPTKSTAWP